MTPKGKNQSEETISLLPNTFAIADGAETPLPVVASTTRAKRKENTCEASLLHVHKIFRILEMYGEANREEAKQFKETNMALANKLERRKKPSS